MLRAPTLVRSLLTSGVVARVPLVVQTLLLRRAQSSLVGHDVPRPKLEKPVGGCPFLSGGNSPTSERIISETMLDKNKQAINHYGDYLGLEKVLTAAKPLSQAHDELLFIIMHQTKELWLKLVGHEMLEAIRCLHENELHRVSKILARVKTILNVMQQQWSVLATMTPEEYLAFRPVLGPASGFQSAGYRSMEFLLGNKNRAMMTYFENDPDTTALLTKFLEMPSIYDEFLAHLSRHGVDIPAEVLERDVTIAWTSHPAVIQAFKRIYSNTDQYWDAYDIAEKLLDIDDAMCTWRFKHLTTVSRFIGYKEGTGGSSGIGFLSQITNHRFFPELWEVRSEM